MYEKGTERYHELYDRLLCTIRFGVQRTSINILSETEFNIKTRNLECSKVVARRHTSFYCRDILKRHYEIQYLSKLSLIIFNKAC
jgi:hypothetical protein